MTTAREATGAPPPDPAGAAADGQAAPDRQVSRRTYVRDALVAGSVVAAGAALAACSSSRPAPAAQGTKPTPGAGAAAADQSTVEETAPPAPPAVTAPPAGSQGSGGSAAVGADQFAEYGLGKVSAIPVGGGVVYPGHGVVVTQPTAGRYKCFSASCTHLGCLVDRVTAGVIRCPCHGATFSIVDGSVKAGPAQRPLTAQQISIQDGKVILG